jgi:protein TonB
VAAAQVKKAVPPQAIAVVVQTPAASVAKVAAATPAAIAARPTVVASAPATKIVQPSPARSEAAEDDGPRVVEPPPVSVERKSEAAVAPKAPENVAAKILSAPQPPFPPWAKTLDVSSVVKLDAVIDEKGNLGEMKIVYGPRLLERAAQQAVQLWIFEPARLAGKSAESHIVLTVEFQR